MNITMQQWTEATTAQRQAWLDAGATISPRATCSPEVADWIDPSGALRDAGLLEVA